jgi:GR25 family glycosyltransferase involved in LPS biosynthesis
MIDSEPIDSIKPSSAIHFNIKKIANEHCLTMSDEELDLDWKLNEFFGTLYVINLPKANKRLEKVSQELQEVGVTDFEKFQAIDGRTDLPPNIWKKFHGNRDCFDSSTSSGREKIEKLHQGEAGCYMSHYTLLQKVKKSFEDAQKKYLKALSTKNDLLIQEAKLKLKKFCRVLIFEDDAAFGIVNEKRTKATKKNAGKILREALKKLPSSWDMLYLVIRAKEPSKVITPNLRKMGRSFCALAYAVNHTMYEPLINHLKKIEDPLVTHVEPVDEEISSIHSKHKVYAIAPSIVYHELGPSQISDKPRELLWQGQPDMPQ